MGGLGFDSWQKQNSFFSRNVHTCSGHHPASYGIGRGITFWGANQPGREADHSPPSSAEVENAWKYTSTPRCSFVACVGTLYR